MFLKKVAATTLGCKVNAYDTEAMLELFAGRGYEIVEFGQSADVYIINTCTVTNLGDKKSRQMLRRARRLNQDAIVVAAGCYAQVAADEVGKIPEVDLIIGTKNRSKIVDDVEQALECRRAGAGLQDRVKVGNIMSERGFEDLSVTGLSNRSRAYLKIQEGCNQFCTYCIIPYARGPVRSRDESSVLAEVRSLAANGYKEVVLAGIHVVSYGNDLENTSLSRIIGKIHEIDGIERIRMSSIEPRAVTQEFLDTLSCLPKVCNHFHLSLQSGCGATLKRMNRRYTADGYREAAELLRRYFADVALTTDIIVGFPGETEAEFAESMSFVEEIGFSRIHVFPYSPKVMTPAANFPNQVSAPEKAERSKEMIALGKKMSTGFLERFVGSELSVLYETFENGQFTGHSTNYLTVRTEASSSILHEIRTVRITGISTESDDDPELVSDFQN